MATTRQHPKGLPFLFLTELWERFGFYVVQGLLVLYIAKVFGFPDDQCYTIAGVFSALAYISPMAGGFIADKVLGFKLSIAWGGVFLSAGYALLALPSTHFFYIGLATIVVGNGLFKPNISSILGALYPPGSPGRDSGFTIFYIGINLGVLLASLTSGTIKDHFGWHAGFAIASIGLLFGLSIFAMGFKWGDIHYTQTITTSSKWYLRRVSLFVYCLAAIAVVDVLLQSSILSKWFLPTIGVALLIFVFVLAFRQTPEYRNRLILLNILIISSIVFWTFFMQLFLSANFFIDRLVEKDIYGLHLRTTYFYGLESIFVILLGPLFAWSWQTLAQNNRDFSPFMKFVLAIFCVALCFGTLVTSTYFPTITGLVNPLWIVLAYLFITIGELLLSPIGLSAVTRLSPPHLTGMMMGIWFAALGFGGLFGGIVAKLASVPDPATSAMAQLPIYRSAFLHFTCIAFVIAVVLYLLQVILKKKLKTAS